MTLRFWPLLLVLLVAGCDTSQPDDAPTAAVYVGNQGIFSDNGGSVTRFDVATSAATPDAVPSLDGLVQSLVVYNGRLYVLVNFSDSFTTGRGRIDAIDLATGERVQQVAVNTPRSMAVAGGTAWVTNLYSASVTPVFLATGQAGAPVRVGDNPEGVAIVGQRVFVANSGFGFGTTVSEVSAETRTETRRIEVCAGPRALHVDDDDDLWVVCTGRFDFGTGAVADNGEVQVLDGATGALLARFPQTGLLGTDALGTDAAFSSSRDELFVAAGTRLLRFNTATNTAVEALAVTGAALTAVAVDDTAGRLYLGRADATSPYAADGTVTIHDPATGAQTGTFAAGVLPGAIAFAP